MRDRRTRSAVPARVRRLADLQAAMAGNEIEILFQPQVEMQSGRLSGVEALARWRHPQLGELGPGELLDIAARSNTIVDLSRHIQARALAIAACWPHSLGYLGLSLNVTSDDIACADFVEETLQRLRQTGFPAGRLTLEITETGLVADLVRAGAILQMLRNEGVRIAIDDFGTGYSSLAYLKALPLDILKIDHDFTQDVTGPSRARTIVAGVISLAKALGLTVVAEGVENEAQREALAAHGCDYFQGFLYAPPLTSEQLIDRVTQPA